MMKSKFDLRSRVSAFAVMPILLVAAKYAIANETSNPISTTLINVIICPQPDKTIILSETSKAKTLLSDVGTEGEHLTIVTADGKTHELPTLKESQFLKQEFKIYIDEEISKAISHNIDTWWVRHGVWKPEVSDIEYDWRIEGTIGMMVTNYGINFEAMWTGDSTGNSQYLEWLNTKRAEIVLDSTISRDERLNSAIPLMFDTFGDIKPFHQARLKEILRDSKGNSNKIYKDLRLLSEGCAGDAYSRIDLDYKIFKADPSKSANKIIANCDNDLADLIENYSSSERVGVRNFADILKSASSKPSVTTSTVSSNLHPF